MKINHAQVMAHMCRMTKEANLTGAVVGAGVGAGLLPLIDYMRNRKSRAGVDAVAGGLAGGALGYGLGQLSDHKWNPQQWAQDIGEDKLYGKTRDETSEMLDAAKLQRADYKAVHTALDPTITGAIGGVVGVGRGLFGPGGRSRGAYGRAGIQGGAGYVLGNLLERGGKKLLGY
jgi:hypothetical protein